MRCAHTVRRLKPGTFEQFAEAVIVNGGVHEIAESFVAAEAAS